MIVECGCVDCLNVEQLVFEFCCIVGEWCQLKDLVVEQSDQCFVFFVQVCGEGVYFLQCCFEVWFVYVGV